MQSEIIRVQSTTYNLQQVTNANLKWRDLPSMERHAYCESFDETLKELMKMEYLHDDGDVFVDYLWEKALSVEEDMYLEWCLEFFSTMYFERGVDRTKLMTEKRFWFRLCGREHVLTLPKFAVLLGLYLTQVNWITGSMPNFRGTSIVPSSGYEFEGSSRAIQDDDDDASMSE
ncbi:hypothetical protein Tco_0855626 [Tanacetum coccineum]